ncbi:MAG: oxaloacetate-decarboxylating malate dehydrogenase, partial [Gammaproteobacteria bacterium]|nr:oxaloacetate-decarboxylating malate dehydrogenase [Gammaproteobacteria bacterium]
FHGAGTSATGIADQICDAMVLEGITLEEARSQIWMLGSRGLITEDLANITSFQRTYARTRQEVSGWDLANPKKIELLEVVKNVKPTMLIGCSTVANAFNEEIVREMAKHVERSVIMPLSNPTSKAEAKPIDLYKWTNNKVLVATGSPFASVDVNGKKVRISQCNNAFAFPGIGLGIIAAKANRLTDKMIWAACKAITEVSPVYQDRSAPLLPEIKDVQEVSYKVAIAVAKQAIVDGVASEISDIDSAVKAVMWKPKYYPFKKAE